MSFDGLISFFKPKIIILVATLASSTHKFIDKSVKNTNHNSVKITNHNSVKINH